MFDNIIRVYNKNMELLATFNGNSEGLTEEAMRNLMVAPTVHIESNGLSTLSFQMIPDCEKWLQIRDPENIYVLNDRYYTALEENAYQYVDENGVQLVNVTLSERWILLNRQYNQAYNCGIYTYAKARFFGYTNNGATFTINSLDCSNPGNTISFAMAWEQVKAWTPTDDNGNKLSYAILSSDEYKATGWENVPSGVFMTSISVSENTATINIESRSKRTAVQTFAYSGSSYHIDVSPAPSSVENVTINYTTVTADGTYTTAEKNVPFTYSADTATVTLNYSPAQTEKVNGVMVTYGYSDLGTISPGATCTFAYGAEAVDEHTFVIIPKANTKYKLVIDGVAYEDSQVKDSRGVVMPRGSGGYAMWAALKNSGWTLGICDVIATGFDASIDYGCFNIESDMQDVLYNIQYIQELYGGILDWDSKNKILNYRAENNTDYQAYNDSFNRWQGYEFREGKNMSERPTITYDNKIITKAYLLGYGNLNVKKVNGGRSYIENHSYTEDTYEGYLRQDLIYDTNDEGGQRQLLYWGQKELSKRCKPRKSIEFSAIDIRTVEGHEHEIFDINNIVRAYYKDDITGEYKYDEKRIITWEYNAFAMWESTVELGDKIRNLIEVFRLVYNKTLKAPGVNGSGNISSGNITMGGAWDGNGNYGDENSLTHYIELIARTTTDNSDAIAGLILDTSELYAQADLFAYYQKQTDTLFTEAYAGFHAYADEQMAEAIMEANKYTETMTEELDGSVTERIAETSATLKEYADEEGSRVEAVAKGYYKILNEKIGSLNITSMAGYESIQNQFNAQNNEFTIYKKQVGDQFVETSNRIKTISNEQGTMREQMMSFKNELMNKPNTLQVTDIVDQYMVSHNITATLNELTTAVSVGAYGTTISSQFSQQSTYINISSGGLSFQSNGSAHFYTNQVAVNGDFNCSGMVTFQDKNLYIGGFRFSTGLAGNISTSTVILYAMGT